MSSEELSSASASQPSLEGEVEETLDIQEDEPVAESSDIPEGALESEVDLKKMADDYAKYLVVNSRQDQTALHDRIDGVYTRVDEFKQQLYFLHQNINSNSDKMRELHENTEQLLALFQKIDQMEVFLSMVNSNVDQLEETVTQAEKDLEHGKIRKVFSNIGFGKKKNTPKPESATKNWRPPKVFKAKEYFPHGSIASSSPPVVPVSPSSAPLTAQTDESNSGSLQGDEAAAAQSRTEQDPTTTS